MIGLCFLRYFEGVADYLWLSTWGFVCLFVMCIGRQMLLNGLQIWFAWWDYLSKNRSTLCWDFVNALWTALMTVGLEIVSKDEEFPPSGVTAACCRCLRLQWCPLLAAPLPLSKGWKSNSNVYGSKLPLRLMLWPCLNGATFVLFVPFAYKASIALFEPICTVIFCKLCYVFLRPVDSNLVQFRSLRVRISRQFLLRIILIMGEWVLLFFCWQGSSLLCFRWCFLSWFDCCWFFVDCGIIEALRTATAIRCRSLFFELAFVCLVLCLNFWFVWVLVRDLFGAYLFVVWWHFGFIFSADTADLYSWCHQFFSSLGSTIWLEGCVRSESTFSLFLVSQGFLHRGLPSGTKT